MSVIKPFKGWRPTEDIVLQLASRPYDVLNTEEARKECEGNPYNLLHVTKAEIDPRRPQGQRPRNLHQGCRELQRFQRLWLARPRQGRKALHLCTKHEPNRSQRPLAIWHRGLRMERRLRQQSHQEARTHPQGQGRRPHEARASHQC